MDIVFDIISNILPNTIILLSIIFTEKYNISIGKDDNQITIYFYQSDRREIIKFCGSPTSNKYKLIKKYLINQIENIPLKHITGITSIENKEKLEDNFIIYNIVNIVNIGPLFIEIDKYF